MHRATTAGPQVRAASWAARLDDVASRVERHPYRFLALIAFLLALQIGPWWYPSLDGAGYLSSARHMARGESASAMGRHILPGYPLLIAPAFWLSERPFVILSVWHWMLAVAFLAGVYVWARRIAPSAAVLIAGVAVLNTGFGIFSRRTLKEVAFMAAMVWTAVLIQRCLDCESPARRRWLWLAVGGLATLLLGIRLTGIVMFLALGVAAALHHRGRWSERLGLLLAGGGFLALAVPALLATSGGRAYSAKFLEWFWAWPAQGVEALRMRISDAGRVTLPGMLKAYADRGEWLDVTMVIYVAAFALMLLGWWRLVRTTRDVWALSLPFYFALYLVWPFDQGARFFVCLVPLLTVCGLLAWPVLWERRHAVLALLLVGHAAASYGYWLGVDAPRAWEAHRHWPAVDDVAGALRGEPGRVVVAEGMTDVLAMLQVALDRTIGWQEGGETVPVNVDWFVSSSNAEAPVGFVVRLHSGDLRLFERESLPDIEKDRRAEAESVARIVR